MNPLNVIGAAALIGSLALWYADGPAQEPAAMDEPRAVSRLDLFASPTDPGFLAQSVDAASSVKAASLAEAGSLRAWPSAPASRLASPGFAVALATPSPAAMLIVAAPLVAVAVRRRRAA